MHNENNEVLFLNSIWPGFFCKKILKVFYRDFKLSIIRKTKDFFFFFEREKQNMLIILQERIIDAQWGLAW